MGGGCNRLLQGLDASGVRLSDTKWVAGVTWILENPSTSCEPRLINACLQWSSRFSWWAVAHSRWGPLVVGYGFHVSPQPDTECPFWCTVVVVKEGVR